MPRVKVAAFSISIDGYGAGPRQDLKNPLGVRGTELHGWFRHTDVFKKMQGQSGGSKGTDNDMALQSFENVGAWISGAEHVRAGARALGHRSFDRRFVEWVVGRHASLPHARVRVDASCARSA